MANIVRHEPRQYLTLRDAMDQLFDESFLRPLDTLGFGTATGPAIDVCETENEIVVTAAVPGIKPDDLKLSLIGDVLELRGEVKDESERKQASYHLRERRYGSFSRAVSLPAPVQADKAKADFENGVVTITLPKADGARRKTITVKARK